MKLRVNQGTSVCTMIIMYIAYQNFGGIICGTLPFEPAGFFTSMSHRGLNGDDK